MSRGAKLITALLGLVLVMFIVIPAYWYKTVVVSAGLEKTLVTQLSEQLGRQVTIGSIQVKPTGIIKALDVTVADQGQVLLRAKEMAVSYNMLYILSSSPLKGIRSIEFSQPEIFVDRYAATGEWNIVRFFKDLKKPEKASAFSAALHINDGQISVVEKERNIAFEKVNGTIDFAGNPNLSLSISGMLAGQPVYVKGSVNTSKASFSMQIDAQNQSVEAIAPWLPQADLGVKQGAADVSVLLLQEQYGMLQYNGEIILKDVSAVLPDNGYELTNVDGKVHINNNALFLQGITGKLNGEEVKVQGNVALDGRSPYFDVAIKAENINVKKALPDKTIPVDGSFQAEILAKGSMEDMRLQGVVRMKQGMVNDIAVSDGSASFVYERGWVEVHELQAGVWGGSIKGQGMVKLGDVPVYSAILRLEGVQSPRSDLTGSITGSVFITGDGRNVVSTVWGAGQLENGAIYNIPYEKAETGFYWANNQLLLDHFNLSVGDGWLFVNGTGSSENLDLAVRGENLPLGRLAPVLDNVQISGLAMLQGHIRGSMDNPAVSGNFTAKQGQIMHQSFTDCSGEFTFANKELSLRNVTAIYDNTRHELYGSISFAQEPSLNIHIVSRYAPADEVVKLLGLREQIRGRIDNEIDLRGPLNNLAFEGHMLLTQGEYRGQSIDQAKVNYTYRDGVLELLNCTAVSGGAGIELSGTISRWEEMDLRFAARNIRFGELDAVKSLPYEISGQAEISGTIQGLMQNPRIHSSIKAVDTVINKQRFGDLTGQVDFIDKQLYVHQLTLADGPACYKFQGRIDYNDPPQVEGQLTVREGQVPQLLALLSYAIPEAQGKVTADLVLSGPLSRPDARGRLTVTNGYVKGYPVDILDVDVVAEKGLITFNELELKQGQGFMRAQGTWALDGVLALEVGGQNLDAGFVAALFPNAPVVKGTINFLAQVGGTTENPQAAMSVEIKQGSWANAEFDSLYALVLVEEQIIKLNQIMLIKGPYRASAYGTVPVAALTKKGREEPNSASGMDVRVQLEQADLSILPLLSQQVAWAVGQTHGQVRIGGNLYQPLIYGQFTVTDGTVKFRGMNNPVEHANIDLQFDGDAIRLKTFNGQLGGGNYAGSGSATLKGFTLGDLHLALNLDKLYVNSKYYVGPLEGAFTVEEVRGLPLIKGNLHIVNAQINPPVFWPDENNALPNARLDVEIEVDKNVRLRNPALYDMFVQGKVKAEGTLHRPKTSGRLSVVRGSLQYLSTSFKILEGVADFNQYGSFLPSVRVVAQTRTLDTKVRLEAYGPLAQMDFRLTSEPPMSQEQIIMLLTLRSNTGKNSGGTADNSGSDKNELQLLLNEGLQFTFVQRMEKVFENFLGVDEFHIVRSENEQVTDREVYNLEIGKYLNDKIYLGYTMGINQSDQSILFRYDVTNHLSLDGQWGEKHNRRFGLATRFYF